MTRFHEWIVGFSVIVLLGTTAAVVADEGSNGLPRYRLKVGQELKYTGKSDFRYENGSLVHQTDWTVWVVRANTDGGWRLVVRSSSRMTQSFSGQKSDPAPARVTMAYLDLEPDGRVVPNDSLGYRLDPSTLFPRLPNDAAEASNGWNERDTRQDKRSDYKRSGAAGLAADEWAFDADRHSSMDRIYKMTARDHYVFDVRKGMVKRVELENTQGYGFNGKGTGSLTLLSVEPLAPERVKALERDSERYFAANKKYQDLLTSASKDEKDANALLSRAETTLKDVREQLSKDAKFVVDELSLNYPVLKAEGLPEKYSVRGFPTLIVIDQEGKVADIHVGYSPTLRADVAKSVRKLLARK